MRALVALEETYHFLARRPDPPLPQEPKYLEPIVALVERGREQGEIRNDIPVACLVETLLAVIGACIRSRRAVAMGSEDTSSAAIRLFLTGAAPSPR